MEKYLFCSFALLFLNFSPKCAGGEVIADHVCPTGWDNHLTRCYWYLDIKKLSWQKANEDCQDLGGYLYVPSNDDEGIFVQEALEKRESFSSISEAIWIGCEDQQEERKHVCHEDTGDTGYRNWAYKEPNNNWDFLGGENCISVYTGRPNNSVVPLWNDKDCNVQYHAVCERSGTSLYTITRRFQIPSQISGETARVIPNYCLVEMPDLQPKGVQTASLIRCAVSCADDSQCVAFNFKRPPKKTGASNSTTTYKLKGTCQKLTFTTSNIKTGFQMTFIDGCNYYELECRK